MHQTPILASPQNTPQPEMSPSHSQAHPNTFTTTVGCSATQIRRATLHPRHHPKPPHSHPQHMAPPRSVVDNSISIARDRALTHDPPNITLTLETKSIPPSLRFVPAHKQSDKATPVLSPAKWTVESVVITNAKGRKPCICHDRIQLILGPVI